MKTVTYNEFREAKEQVNKELKRMSNALFNEQGLSNAIIEEESMFGKEDKIVKMCVNWSACGTVEPCEALAMAALLQKAAELASTFIYNGYIIEG